MRIFLGFFGITRSLNHTIGSIRAHIFAPLEQAGVQSPRYGHFHLPERIINRRSGEFGLPTDPAESSLLALQDCALEPQDRDLIRTELAIARRFPDLYGDDYASAQNLCFQLRSLGRLWTMLEPDLTDQDWVAFLRPDLLYLDRLDLPKIAADLARNGADLAVPGWQAWGGLNDRFALANARAARAYATRMARMEAAATARGGLHAETLLGFVAVEERLRVGRLRERAVRIRANGQPAHNDLACFGLPMMRPPQRHLAEASWL
jgi:hypothetical protein